MALSITIAGVDRTDDVMRDGFSIEQVLTSQEDSCDFVVAAGDKPTTGEAVVVADSGVTLFGGIIDAVKATELPGNITRWNCSARDYTYQLNAKLVADVYENKTASYIAADIVTRYCTAFTTTGIDSGSPNVEYMYFEYEKPSECLKRLAEYVGWEWYVDYAKEVQFFDPATRNTAAPIQLTDATDIRNWKHDIDEVGLVNQVYVLGGTMLSDPDSFEFNADGVQALFPLGHKPHNLSMTVGGVAKTIGVVNLHEDDGTYDYMMDYQEKFVRCGKNTSAPAAGTTIVFTYRYDIPVISVVSNIDSQNAVKAVQGGDGIYEYKIKDDSLITLEAAEAAGNDYLRIHADARVVGSFSTAASGWAPGQILTVNSVSRGISGTFTIQKVKISPFGTGLLHSISYGGRIFGLEDRLKALVSAQQASKNQDTVIITKIKTDNDNVTATDTLATTARTPPYICGDADAICGFVLCYWIGYWILYDNVEDIDMDSADYLFDAHDEFDYFYLGELY